jgi:type IV fimbrial biogenesis protein FimT
MVDQRLLLGHPEGRNVLVSPRAPAARPLPCPLSRPFVPGRHAGVTLIELLVGITIVAILVGMGLPSFSVWIQNTQIRTAAESVLNGLQTTRAEAVRRNAPVTFTITNNDWTITDAAAVVIQSRNASEGSSNTVLAAAGTSPLTFNGLGRPVAATVPVAGSSNAIQITITNPTGGTCQDSGAGTMRCLRVDVTMSGQVRMCDPMFANTDPQGC